MLVNGKKVEYESISLLQYLQQEGFNPAHVVVERGGEILTRERFASVMLADSDEINILHFMGGG